jgi:hypothetical protein
MSAAQTALNIAEASLGVSVAGVIANVSIWVRSGGRFRVRVDLIEHAHDRLLDAVRVEVHNVGRQPAVLRGVQLGKRVQTGTAGRHAAFETVMAFTLMPNPAEPNRIIAPTDFAVFDIPLSDVMEKWGQGESLMLQASAVRGDGKIRYSNVIRVKTPRRVPK